MPSEQANISNGKHPERYTGVDFVVSVDCGNGMALSLHADIFYMCTIRRWDVIYHVRRPNGQTSCNGLRALIPLVAERAWPFPYMLTNFPFHIYCVLEIRNRPSEWVNIRLVKMRHEKNVQDGERILRPFSGTKKAKKRGYFSSLFMGFSPMCFCLIFLPFYEVFSSQFLLLIFVYFFYFFIKDFSPSFRPFI